MFGLRLNIGKAIALAPLKRFVPNPKLKLLDQVRNGRALKVEG
jgi:hypothetical protein